MGEYRDTNFMMVSEFGNNTRVIWLKSSVFNCLVYAGMFNLPSISPDVVAMM